MIALSDVAIFLTPLAVGLGLPAIFNPRTYAQCGLRSSLQPPGYVFGIAWTLLYALYGASCVAAWIGAKRRFTPGLIAAFFTLACLAAWSLVFMTWCLPHYAYLAILAILGLVVATTMLLVHAKLLVAALLMIPLIAWMAFATYLSYASIPM